MYNTGGGVIIKFIKGNYKTYMLLVETSVQEFNVKITGQLLKA